MSFENKKGARKFKEEVSGLTLTKSTAVIFRL